MLGLEAYLKYFNISDPTVLEGIKILEEGDAFPKAPKSIEVKDTAKDGKKKRTAQANIGVEVPLQDFSNVRLAVS